MNDSEANDNRMTINDDRRPNDHDEKNTHRIEISEAEHAAHARQ